MSNGTAPVCPITRSQAPSAQPGIVIPPIPRASDLPSAINAINQLIQTVNWMLSPPVINNALFINNMPFPKMRWAETKRVVEPVRIVSNQDPNVWIDIQRISSVSFTDNVTQSALQWNYVNKALQLQPKT